MGTGTWSFTLVAALALSHGGLERRPQRQTIVVPGDAPSIQTAIDIARYGDEVVVKPGTYNETIDFMGKAITVRSAEGPKVTTITGQGTYGQVVRFHNEEGPDSRLLGFRVTRGAAGYYGAGISCQVYRNDPAASPYIENCVIEKNYGSSEDGSGFGIGVGGGSPTLVNCHIRDNIGGSGGCHGSAPSYGGGVWGSPTMIGCVVEGNEASSGGGLWLEDGSYLVDCIIRDNSVGPSGCIYRPIESMGGGAVAWGISIFEGCLFTGNQVFGYCTEEGDGYCLGSGGALVAYRPSPPAGLYRRWERCRGPHVRANALRRERGYPRQPVG